MVKKARTTMKCLSCGAKFGRAEGVPGAAQTCPECLSSRTKVASNY